MRRFAALCAVAVAMAVALAVALGGVVSPAALADPGADSSAAAGACGLPVRTSWPSEHTGREEMDLSPRGTAVAQTFYVDFADSPADPSDIPIYEAALDGSVPVLRQQSRGAFSIERRSLVDGWHRMPGLSSDYYGRTTDLVADAIRLVDAAIDFSDVDVVWVVWKGADQGSEWRTGASNLAHFEVDGRTLNRYVAMRPVDINGYRGEWVPAHETGHSLGLPDLYDTGLGPLMDQWTGSWDMMANSRYDGQGRTLLGWHQWRLGWMPDDDVRCVRAGTTAAIALSPVESSTGTRLALVRLDATRVLAVESRRGEGLDAGIPKAGALVYTIDALRESGHGPVRVEFGDGAAPENRDADTLALAPLQPGQVYTDPATGVSVSVTAAAAGGDEVVVDGRPLASASPKKTIAYYRTMIAGGHAVSPLELMEHGTGVDVVDLSTLHVDATGIRFNDVPYGDAATEALRADLRRMRDAGVAVIGTLGEAGDGTWAALSADFAHVYGEVLYPFLLSNELDGVEIPADATTDIGLVTRLVDALRHDLGPSFRITVAASPASLAGSAAPSGLDVGQLYRERGGDIDWITLWPTCAPGESTSASYLRTLAAQRDAGVGVPPEKLVLGALTTPALCADPSAWTDPAALQAELSRIVAVEPRFGGIAGWEYAGSLPGGPDASWVWTALMRAAMFAGPGPVPDPGGGTPPPTLAATGVEQASGPVVLLGAALACSGALAVWAARRRVSRAQR